MKHSEALQLVFDLAMDQALRIGFNDSQNAFKQIQILIEDHKKLENSNETKTETKTETKE